MKTKDLIKIMTFPEVNEYIENHPQWRLPTIREASSIEPTSTEHRQFWTSETTGDRRAVWNKDIQEVVPSHWNFKQNVLLISNKL
jgi:hypothetical protein